MTKPKSSSKLRVRRSERRGASAVDRAIVRWLAYESKGQERQAEAALRRVFRMAPQPEPSKDLSARILRRLGVSGLAPVQPLAAAAARSSGTRGGFGGFGARLAAGLVLASSGLAVALAAALLRADTAGIWLVDLGAGALAAMSQRLATVLTLADVVSRVAAVATEAIATPGLLGVVLAALFCGLASFRYASGPMVDRSTYHA